MFPPLSGKLSAPYLFLTHSENVVAFAKDDMLFLTPTFHMSSFGRFPQRSIFLIKAPRANRLYRIICVLNEVSGANMRLRAHPPAAYYKGRPIDILGLCEIRPVGVASAVSGNSRRGGSNVKRRAVLEGKPSVSTRRKSATAGHFSAE